MEIAVSSLAFLVAAFCAGVMGFAIQRGATCTVVAVDEVVCLPITHILARPLRAWCPVRCR